MDKNYPKNRDPRPKRRHSKDNPYEIFSVGAHTDRPHYYIAFTDSTGIRQELEVDKAVFDTLDRFGLPETVEETVMQRDENERLHKAIAMLPAKQRKRLTLYYLRGLNYAQIAEIEGCKYQTVQESIYAALAKLKKFLI